MGANLGATTQISGTVGAATEASKEGVPGIAFSGSTGSQTAWTVSPVPAYSTLYAELSANVTDTLVASGAPYLPSGIWLNVNYPEAGSGTSCTSTEQFKFVLSRINTATTKGRDVVTCDNGGNLPTETSVVDSSGCFASISVGVATTKSDANSTEQAVVLNKLEGILSCLPS